MSEESKNYQFNDAIKNCFSNFKLGENNTVNLQLNIKDLPKIEYEFEKETIDSLIESIIGSFKNRLLYIKKIFINDKHLVAFEKEMRSNLKQYIDSLSKIDLRENALICVSEENSNLIIKVNKLF